MPRAPLCRVAVTGGTHGNEMSGVHLVQHWLQAPGELQRPSFSAIPVLANPAAAAACRRYVDRDLNRMFASTFLTYVSLPLWGPLTARPALILAPRSSPQSPPPATSKAHPYALNAHSSLFSLGRARLMSPPPGSLS